MPTEKEPPKSRHNHIIGELEQLTDDETHYCDNEFCDNEAGKQVPVSVEAVGDEQRWFCHACEQAYTIGCRHGTMRTEAERQQGENP